MTNWPRDKVFEWFIRPLFVMKEQVKGLQLKEDEEICLKKLIMVHKNERPDDWDNTGFPSSDKVRRAQLQALIRRLVLQLCLLYASEVCINSMLFINDYTFYNGCNTFNI